MNRIKLCLTFLVGFGIPCLVPIARSEVPWVVRGTSAMVAADSHHASAAGLEILRKGGNAFDAAAAVSFALAVTRPYSTGLGGGGFLIGRRGADGSVFVLDYRETAPAAATTDMYRDDAAGLGSRYGYRAVGVPGQVAGIDRLLKLHGTKSMGEVIEPALRLARDGFEVDEHYAKACQTVLGHYQEDPSFRQWGGYVWRAHLREGHPRQPGEVLKQPELARLLDGLAKHGATFFYKGEFAKDMVAHMQRQGGIITAADLADYSVKERRPLRTTYRGYEIIAMPPPSSGGICLAEILNILELRDLSAVRRDDPARATALVIEAMKHAFADRARWLGDADFVDVPVDRLIDKGYAAALAEHSSAKLPADQYGTREFDKPSDQLPQDGGTSHFCIVDRWGNCVVSTETINTEFGSLAAVDEWGLILNNEMDDFTARPGEPNAFGLIQSARNAIAPGKRPLSSMSPTMVLMDGKPVLILGASGGPRIITSVLQVLINVVDYDCSLAEAMAARRFHHQWQPDHVYFDGPPDTTLAAKLKAMGYTIDDDRREGVVQAIRIDGNQLVGASDPRKGGGPAGE